LPSPESCRDFLRLNITEEPIESAALAACRREEKRGHGKGVTIGDQRAGLASIGASQDGLARRSVPRCTSVDSGFSKEPLCPCMPLSIR